MSLENAVEVTGESIEVAIRKGLEALNAAPYEVIVEVLEEPSSGMFGGEARPAKVRLKRLSMPKPPMEPPPPPPPEPPLQIPQSSYSQPAEPAPQSQPRRDEPRQPRENRENRDRDNRSGDRENRGGGDRTRSSSGRSDDRRGGGDRRGGDRRGGNRGGERRNDQRREEPGFAQFADSELPDAGDYGVTDEETPMFMDADLVPEAEQDDEAQVAKVVLETLLEHMSLRTTIEVRRAKATEGEESSPWVLNITGTRFGSRLVGRRGETLASLQYLTRLITSRELQRRAELIVDVDGYKAKRASSLRTLATRLADDAVQSQRTVTLEPMPPHERRIIHLALRERTDVTTRSVGEGTARKVTIVPSASA